MAAQDRLRASPGQSWCERLPWLLLAHGLRALDREDEPKRRAAGSALFSEVRELSAMLDGDALSDGKPEPCPLGLGGRVRLEEARGDLGRYAGPVVLHRDVDETRRPSFHADDHPPGRLVSHGLERVLHEIHQDLDDLVAIRRDSRND